MRITIDRATELSVDILTSLGFGNEEAGLITDNLIDAELANKKTHGFITLLYISKLQDSLNVDVIDLDILERTTNSLYIDGHHKLGYSIIYKSLDLAFEIAQSSKVVCVGIKDIFMSGYIGSYARKATDNNFVFIGFHNSSGGLVPYGAKKAIWGTNPLTVGIPTDSIPIILDMASSKITGGEALKAITEKLSLKKGVAIDSSGNLTTDPNKFMDGGGLLPISGHKGSGLAFIVELLGGALTGSRVGFSVPGGWGAFYILLDPTLFRPIADFNKDVESAIDELKSAPKMAGFTEIYFPGEQSYLSRQRSVEEGEIEISENIHRELLSISRNKE